MLYFYNSPLSFLKSLKNIKVNLRNEKSIQGKLKMFDKHLNCIVKINKEEEIFIRGDNIISINKI